MKATKSLVYLVPYRHKSGSLRWMTTTTRTAFHWILIFWTAACFISFLYPHTDAYPIFVKGVAGLSTRSSPPSHRGNNNDSKNQHGKQSPRRKNKNRVTSGGGNKSWYEKRKAGIKVSSRGPKPPKWEREGDDLYVSSKNKMEVGNMDKNISYETARALLRSIDGTTSGNDESRTTNLSLNPPSKTKASFGTKEKPSEGENETGNLRDDKPFLWGGKLSIGPFWKSRLVAAGYSEPTPIQIAAYNCLSTKKNQTSVNGNAVIAAATGSGKSLAYLLPFLTSRTTTGRKNKKPAASVTNALGTIWIMTPTMELAYQLQRTVDHVILGSSINDNRKSSSSNVLHVVEYNRSMAVGKLKLTRKEESSSPLPLSVSYPILADIVQRYYSVNKITCDKNDPSVGSNRYTEPTFLAGTPKLFLQLRKEIQKVVMTTSKLQSNTRYAAQRKARQRREAKEGTVQPPMDTNTNERNENTNQEQLLYRAVALALRANIQTLILDEVDRLLQTTTADARREHKTTKPLAQELLEALVWEKTAKSRPPTSYGRNRRNSQRYSLPQASSPKTSLQIVCASATIGRALRKQLMYIVKAPSTDKAATLITADVRTKKDEKLRKASLLPSNLKHSYGIMLQPPKKEGNIKKLDSGTSSNITSSTIKTNAMVEALVTTLRSKEEPSPSLVFPGAIGVEAIRESLANAGFQDIRGLSDLREEMDAFDSLPYSSWSCAPVYVVKERLARGLDLPEIRTVFLMGVPSNAAAYAHLAGRTARQNAYGECITLCWPWEAQKLISIAKTLGLNRMNCINDHYLTHSTRRQSNAKPGGNRTDNRNDRKGIPLTEEVIDEWDLSVMTKTAIKRKTVSALRKFLASKGVPTEGLLKSALVDAAMTLKDK